jgi:hypothetical protein
MGKIVCKTLSQKNPSPQKKRLAEWLRALSSNLSTVKKKKRKYGQIFS